MNLRYGLKSMRGIKVTPRFEHMQRLGGCCHKESNIMNWIEQARECQQAYTFLDIDTRGLILIRANSTYLECYEGE